MINTWLVACSVAAMTWLSPPEDSGSGQDYAREMKYVDADGDGQIDARELAAGQQMASMILMLSWDECDRDNDGSISPAEFQVAAEKAVQALLEVDSESEQQAQDDLAEAVPLALLLDRLAADERYAAEIAALRAELEDADDSTVIKYINQYPSRYPRLTPLVHTWARHYPVRPEVRRLVKPVPKHPYRPRAKAKTPASSTHAPKSGKLPVKRPPKPGKKGPKARKP